MNIPTRVRDLCEMFVILVIRILETVEIPHPRATARYNSSGRLLWSRFGIWILEFGILPITQLQIAPRPAPC